MPEQGVSGDDLTFWAGFMALTGTPRPIVEQLRAATLQALDVPGVRVRLEGMAGDVCCSMPEEMAAMVSAELKKWTAVVNESNIPKQ